MIDAQTPRELIESSVIDRATHLTAESVQTTVSFARAERLLGREYYGRFLIELLQNAADAWRTSRRPGRSRVRILITEGPTLIVANRGDTFPAKVVIESLGHIGRSTKPRGEAIGYKGIGFKSVLEISLTPELYSGLQSPVPDLAVRFDPRKALSYIRNRSPKWTTYLADIEDVKDDELAAVPTLRFPQWVDDVPGIVGELAREGFDTAVVLPFVPDYGSRIGLSEHDWLAVVRRGVDEISDEVLLLLGVFDEIRIEDRVAGTVAVIEPRWSEGLNGVEHASCEAVQIFRDDTISSDWLIYRREASDGSGKVRESAVGIRLKPSPGPIPALRVMDAQASLPFHLFFPTKIGSGLPFLLHGYFEVNAARTGFYEGSRDSNRQILDELTELVSTAVRDAAENDRLDLCSLVDLLAHSPAPEDPTARAFKSATLDSLDQIRWVPLADAQEKCGTPTEVLADANQGRLVKEAAGCFSPHYVHARIALHIANSRISVEGLSFLGSRPKSRTGGIWEWLGELLRPGDLAPWPSGGEDEGFRKLLDLVAVMQGTDRATTFQLLSALRGDAASRLLPVPAVGGGRVMLALPDPSEGAVGRRSQLVMARIRPPDDIPLMPPTALDLAFLPDGLLQNEAEIDRAKSLGVRPFTVDNVLDRLTSVAGSTSNPTALVEFLWALLTRERRSEFGTRNSAQKAQTLDPNAWFWLDPGRADGADSDQSRQRRERSLASIELPTRRGDWRRAGTLAFGSDWAEWINSTPIDLTPAAIHQRSEAYRDLDQVLEDDEMMLASPAKIFELLRDAPMAAIEDHDEVKEGPLSEGAINLERLAFLLRLGVWEFLPIEGFENRASYGRPNFPWPGIEADRQREVVNASGGWNFDRSRWSGGTHRAVFAAEDFRFPLDLADAAARDPVALTRSLERGIALYRKLSVLIVFCPGCTNDGSRHQVPYKSAPHDRYPSLLAIQIRNSRWVPTVRDGVPTETPSKPSEAWWIETLPNGSALQFSPWRFLPACVERAVGPALRDLAEIPTLQHASVSQVGRLLHDLREESVGRAVPEMHATSSARSSVVALHREAYERLAALVTDRAPGVRELLAETGVLCDSGGGFEYREPNQARHDDGRFAPYRRLFAGLVPFIALPRDKASVAQLLGVTQFIVSMRRRGEDVGLDVTDELADIVGERIPELLSIVVNHSLGSQTLDPGGQEFKIRADRLTNLRVFQVHDLVLDATVQGMDFEATIGQGAEDELFVDGATSSHPRVFHDLLGEGWRDRFRRKIAPALATVVENPAYAATFSLFLQADSDAERESALHELGITQEDVDAIRRRLGALTYEDRATAIRWYNAILAARGEPPVTTDRDPALFDALVAAGFAGTTARALTELGGGDALRRDESPTGALRLLVSAGVDLGVLDQHLRSTATDDGLEIRASHRQLRAWVAHHGRTVAAVLARRMRPAEAKALIEEWEAPAELALSLDPDPQTVLTPVIRSLRLAGFDPVVSLLVHEPEVELARLADVNVAELPHQVALLYDEEEQGRIAREAAAAWRRELVLLGVLARSAPADTRAALRSHSLVVEQLLAASPAAPADLVPALGELLSGHLQLSTVLAGMLAQPGLARSPDHEKIRGLADIHGLPVDRLDAIQHALGSEGRDLVRRVRDHIKLLKKRGLQIQIPSELQMLEVKTPIVGAQEAQKHVSSAQVDVGTGLQEKKRRIGDEAEQMALAAVIAKLLALNGPELRAALAEVDNLLAAFKGLPVDNARAHVQSAGSQNLEDDERIEELEALLRVSQYAGFGFDLIGWMSPHAGAPQTAIALEAKSSADGGFHLSTNEWDVAQRCHDGQIGYPYGVLVAMRSAGSQIRRLDLLVDPVALVASRFLTREPDGYVMRYKLVKP